jgi:hypothetical protein
MSRYFSRVVFLMCVALAGGAPLVHAQSDTCQQGYVWREACPGDHVCVTPETRAQVAADNAAAASRTVSANSDRCVEGYVWRTARPEDRTCVTPETRKQTEEDNRLAASRVAGAPQGAPPVRNLPRGFHIVDESLTMARSHQLGIAGQAGPLSWDNIRGRLHPAPAAPLSSNDLLNALQNNFGIPATGVFPDREARITGYHMAYGNRNLAVFSETDAPALTGYTAVGNQGYAEIDLSVFPNKQYLLDCPIGQDCAYNVQMWFFDSNQNVLQAFAGSPSSFSGHLLIPFPTAPAGTQSGDVDIDFTGGSNNNPFTLSGCQLDNVSQ